MKRILTVGLLLCLLILSASSSTVLLHNQWDDDNDPPDTTTDRKKGHIEVVVDRTITDLGSSAKCFVSSTVLIEPAEQGGSFVAFGQVRGIADKNSALNPLYTPPRVIWQKVSSTGVPEWISESELDRTRKTKFVRRPPAPNKRLLYSAAEKHSVGWIHRLGLGPIQVRPEKKTDLRLSESAEITKTKLSGSGMGKAAVIAMFSPYAEAKGRATGAQQSHVPGAHVNTDMSIEDEDDENDNDEMGVASDDSTDGGNESDFISETLTPKPLPTQTCPSSGCTTTYTSAKSPHERTCYGCDGVYYNCNFGSEDNPKSQWHHYGYTHSDCGRTYRPCDTDAGDHETDTFCRTHRTWEDDCNRCDRTRGGGGTVSNGGNGGGGGASGSSIPCPNGICRNGKRQNPNNPHYRQCANGHMHWSCGPVGRANHQPRTCNRCGNTFRRCSNETCTHRGRTYSRHW